MAENDRISTNSDFLEQSGTKNTSMPLSKTALLERNDCPISENKECSRHHEKFHHNGNFYEWNYIKPNSGDPWIPRSKGSKSKYFCVKNDSSLDSSPKNEVNFCSKCNSVLELNYQNPSSKCPDNPMTKSKRILLHFRKFCETTSLRGVPRIVHSQKKRFRCLWIVFVFMFFIACMTCLILLIKQYRAYDVIHQPKTSYNDTSNFPSITFCNLRPFSSKTINFIKNSNVKTLMEYIGSLMNSSKSLNLSRDERDLFSSTFSLELFLMNFPSSVDISTLGHSIHSLIISCEIQYANGSELSRAYCESGGKWILTKNELFLNCYTYTISKKYLSITKAVDLTLHLDDRVQFDCPDCHPFVTSSQMTGIRFSLHTANTYPDVINEGQNLSPGTFTDAVFYTKQWNMMEPPYGKCSKELTPTYNFEEGEFLYSLSGCRKYIIQNLLYDNCNCIKFNNIPLRYAHLNKSKDVCNFIEHSIFRNSTKNDFDFDSFKIFVNRTRCKKIVSHKFLDDYTTCTVSCQYYTYDVKVSSGIYPTKSFHLSFIKNIKGILRKKIKRLSKSEDISEVKSIVHKLKVYDVISDMVKNGSFNEAEKLLKSTDVIEKNFLTIQINRQDFTIIRVEEKEVFSITSFLSQTGGMFSIWSGITFFCLVEFIELMMNIFDTVFNSQS